jgi:hypothetical protein
MRLVTSYPTIICDRQPLQVKPCSKCGGRPSYQAAVEFGPNDTETEEMICKKCLADVPCERCGACPAAPTEITQDLDGRSPDHARVRNVLLCKECVASPDLVEPWAEEKDFDAEYGDYRRIVRDEAGKRVRRGSPAA